LNFAREGLLFIAIAAVIAIGGFGFAITRRSWGLWLAAFVLLLLALWVAYFFRDPERLGERGPSLVVSPADGKLIMITEVDEPRFIKGRAIRLSIFMNVFNVHVNRYPVDGIVRYVHYNKGKFFNAAAEKSSLENEQMSVGIDTGRYNAGQKGYYWFAVVLGLVLFLTGLPIWGGALGGAAGIHHIARFLHHGAFLLMVGGFIIHVYMSTIMFPGTMSSMTSGRVTRAWAAWHHPRWFRDEEKLRGGAGR